MKAKYRITTEFYLYISINNFPWSLLKQANKGKHITIQQVENLIKVSIIVYCQNMNVTCSNNPIKILVYQVVKYGAEKVSL